MINPTSKDDSDAKGQNGPEARPTTLSGDGNDVLFDRTLFTLDDQQHDAFMRALDNPGPPNERLKRLMTEKSPWEK